MKRSQSSLTEFPLFLLGIMDTRHVSLHPFMTLDDQNADVCLDGPPIHCTRRCFEVSAGELRRLDFLEVPLLFLIFFRSLIFGSRIFSQVKSCDSLAVSFFLSFFSRKKAFLLVNLWGKLSLFSLFEIFS